MTPLRVLVVDDSVTIRAMLEQMIDCEPGCEVVGTAASADEADFLMRTCRADVMTLDLTMPGIDGLHFLRHLKDRYHPPIVILSSNAKNEAAATREALAAGASACFDKAEVLANFPAFLRISRRSVRVFDPERASMPVDHRRAGVHPRSLRATPRRAEHRGR